MSFGDRRMREAQLWENARFSVSYFSLSFFSWVLRSLLILVTQSRFYSSRFTNLIATTTGLSASSTFFSISTITHSSHSSYPQRGWNKQNPRPSEPSSWTLERVGWDGGEIENADSDAGLAEGFGGVRWVFFFLRFFESLSFLGF